MKDWKAAFSVVVGDPLSEQLDRKMRGSLYCVILWIVGSIPPTTLAQISNSVDDSTKSSERLRQIEYFESHIRPILVERCSECHGSEKQESGLRLNNANSLKDGGISGAAVQPGNPDESLLIAAVEHRNSLEMPPGEKLSDAQINSLRQWVIDGAVWPESDPLPLSVDSIAEAAKSHWAFQPLSSPSVPTFDDHDWVRSPIDAFVLSKLKQAGLQPSESASRATLIRRVSYGLTGLPPTRDQVEQFVADSDPHAYEKLVDRLLDSPHYGEHWGRHWLDVARYSDTKGYVYAREERFWTHAWTYRDWVVRSINNDLPYDRFLLLQLAADQTPDATKEDLAAMGFLTLGRRFLGVRRDIIDDQIDVVTRGTLGLTVGCARCHDHKFDPIPSADYYSLYGVFNSCIEDQVVLDSSEEGKDFQVELQKRVATLNQKLDAARDAATLRMRSRIEDYLYAQSELSRYPADGFDQIFSKEDLLPVIVRNWSRFLEASAIADDDIFPVLRESLQISPEAFDERIDSIVDAYCENEHSNRLIVDALNDPIRSYRELCERFGAVFRDVDAQWQQLQKEAVNSGSPRPSSLPDSDAESLRKVLYGKSLYGVPGPCCVPEGGVSNSEQFFDTDTLTELWKLQGEVDRWLLSNPQQKVARILRDRPNPIEPQIFRRGDPLKPGRFETRHFLTAFQPEPESFELGSGRWELAQSIISPDNPLTARVFVNRVWMQHFGAGLVRTPSDFGLRAESPSHPELLDWLTQEFIKSGWSLKSLHRAILSSATYRQSSLPPDSRERREINLTVDPENRLLWRMNPRRLTFEELRDSMLQIGGDLERKAGGKPVDLFAQPFSKRRTIYGTVDRQYFPGALRVFDFANPDLHIAKRNETTVPQQALFFLNSPLVLERARTLARDARSEDFGQGVVRLYQAILQRLPTPDELELGREFLATAQESQKEMPPVRSQDWSYGRGRWEPDRMQVSNFTSLPFFSGESWQGGPQYPDASWGWIQLNAEGGHPGNTRGAAAVRRWTAPTDMSISIQSHWQHEPEVGDGIRVFVVGSDQGLLQSSKVYHQAIDLNVKSISVTQGDTLDFVVDIDEILNSDQFHCEITIEELNLEGQKETPRVWNSRQDFSTLPVNQLDKWEQLAHLLLCTNEFLFVD